jgi:hypothetical protein
MPLRGERTEHHVAGNKNAVIYGAAGAVGAAVAKAFAHEARASF